ncbi:MAG: acyl-CoA desaturase [Phycisphaerales bacterium]
MSEAIVKKSARRRAARHRLKIQVVTLCAVVIPFVGFLAAVVLLWGVALDWVHLALLGGMYAVTAVGITVGYHRLFTHRSFQAVAPVRVALAVMGSMAVEGPVLQWAAMHRKHHQHSDTEEDPHSPHVHGDGVVGTLRGFWHAHVGWLFKGGDGGLGKYVPDLHSDRALRAVSRLFPLWVLLGLLIPAVLGGLLTLSWTGALLGFLWGGLARIFIVHHLTWSINSVCHIWGTRPFRSHDESRNNAIMGVLGLGEGWHNNHHAFPASARHGLRWWEIDASYWIIRLLVLCRLASEVRVPSPERIAAQRAGGRMWARAGREPGGLQQGRPLHE